jgi:hypothetical protein
VKLDDDEQHFTLSTGRRFYAYGAILGLGPQPLGDDARLRITYGHDGEIEYDHARYGSVTDDEYFTREERQEIAAFMVELWQRWAAQ